MSEKVNTWNQLLKNSLHKKQIIQKNLLCLGNSDSGKRSIINKIQQLSQTQYSSKYESEFQQLEKSVNCGLDFTYFNYQDDDINSRINVFTLDSIKQQYLLKIFANVEFFQNLMVLIVLSYENLSDLLVNLHMYLDSMIKIFQSMKLPLQKMDELRNKLQDFWQAYQEPVLDEDGNLIKTEQVKQQFQKPLPISNGVLEINIGIPLIIILSKGDLVENTLRDNNGEQKLNILQYCLRNIGLTHGAGILSFSLKNQGINVNVLYEYMLHVFFDIPFKHKADLSYDHLFIPIGYDSQSLIAQSFPNYHAKDNLEETFTIDQKRKTIQPVQEIKCEDLQDFLQNLKQKLGGATQKPVSQVESQSNMLIKDQSSDDSVKMFYANLMRNTAPQKPPQDLQKLREKAEEEIINRLNARKTVIKDQKSPEFEKNLDMINNHQDK